MRVRKLTFTAALVVAAGLSLTACNDDDGTGQSAPPSASTTSSSTGGSDSGGPDSGGSDQGDGKGSAGQGSAGQDSAGQGSAGADSTGGDSAGNGSGGQGAAAGTGSDESGKAGRCRADDLEITATDNTIEGDPDGTVVVQLTNSGGRDCVVSGYAGVDLKTGAGPLSAKRTGQQATSITLKSGKSAAFGINYPINKTGGSGVRITGLLVTPPNETKTVTLDWPGAATLPVTEGPGSPVKVGPVGSAGQGG
ncbi:DUF4232 domain-containing protein [Streptomyces sp. NBC_01077]|uniref:DUF4232 domain-containing protein n=1 Tax=Streptomyces sp. NBC_01077 TaxID=2903746 RepID=UPI00386C1098|nr:DUF4232 domain-containing protein [Streptomyces sp. NBC_01077]